MNKENFYAQAINELKGLTSSVLISENDVIVRGTDQNGNDIVLPSQSEIDTKAQELLNTHNANEQAQADLKASAKAKLIAGEALTQDEANTIVL
tara:strand:- start:21 stop:302 length:282 start_codon:yes stop_codon:yes gene_type:complete